jgi:hypothetical protein
MAPGTTTAAPDTPTDASDWNQQQFAAEMKPCVAPAASYELRVPRTPHAQCAATQRNRAVQALRSE